MVQYKFLLLALAAALASCAAPPNVGGPASAAQSLAPTGKLRAAISVGSTATTFRATVDPTTNRLRGVPVDLATALANKLRVPLELLPYTKYVDLLEAARGNSWDVTFLPFDEERAKVMDYGATYFAFEFTYLVPSGSMITTQTDVDRPGVRIAVVDGSVTANNRQKFLKKAVLLRFKTLDEVRDQIRAGKVDAAAAGRESLVGLAAQVPGSRVLQGSFYSTGVAVAVPRNRPAALAYVTQFIETAKATGMVRQVFDNEGFTDAPVAPLASRP